MRYRPWPSVLAVTIVLAVFPTLAADGAIPIWEPTTITESGSYIVTRDISSGQAPAIVVQADDVAIDLNGFAVTGGVRVEGWETPEGTFVLENGKIIAGQDQWDTWIGIQLDGDLHNVIIRHLQLVGGTINVNDAVDNATIENNVLRNAAIALDVGSAVVRNNQITQSPYAGIDIESCGGCDISGNVINQATYHGMWARCHDSVIARNTVTNCGDDGILIPLAGPRNRLEHNALNSNAGFGLHIEANDNVYTGNTARGNGGSACTGTASGGDFCDQGTHNTSHGDNYMPGQM